VGMRGLVLEGGEFGGLGVLGRIDFHMRGVKIESMDVNVFLMNGGWFLHSDGGCLGGH
jgi:hypothetical protein